MLSGVSTYIDRIQGSLDVIVKRGQFLKINADRVDFVQIIC